MPTPPFLMSSARSEDEAGCLLARAALVSVAGIAADGSPSLCTAVPVHVESEPHAHELHVRVAGDVGTPPVRVVVAAHEHVVAIDDVTYWLGARAEGTLEHAGPRAPAGVARLRLERATSIVELGQSSPLDDRRRIVERLWQRGLRGDAGAVTFLLARFPELGTPSFLCAGAELEDRGVRLQCGVGGGELDELLDLLQDLYWLADVPRGDIRAAVVASTALVSACDRTGRIVAFARAVSDRKCAWIYDVVVAPPLRGTRIGSAVMKVLLDHPDVRGVRHVRLSTRDAMTFYRRLGFCELSEAPRYPWTSTEMIRRGVGFRTPASGVASRTPPAKSERAADTEAGRAVADQRIEARLGELAGRS